MKLRRSHIIVYLQVPQVTVDSAASNNLNFFNVGIHEALLQLSK